MGARWQDGLPRFTLLEALPPLRLLLILDNLAGHKSTAFVGWLMAHGIMPQHHAAVYRACGVRWLNRAEPVQRIRANRSRSGQHPTTSEELIL